MRIEKGKEEKKKDPIHSLARAVHREHYSLSAVTVRPYTGPFAK